MKFKFFIVAIVFCNILFLNFLASFGQSLSATISGSVTVEQDASEPEITFTGSNGQAPYTFTYNINGGSNMEVSTPYIPSMGNKKLLFIHHSTGGQLLADGYGGLGKLLKNEGYFVSDICYNWSVLPYNYSQGNYTDIGQWYSWFADESVQPNGVAKRDNIMNAVYTTYNQDQSFGVFTRGSDPGGENEIIMIKSCYPNSHVQVANSSTPEQFFNQIYSSPNHNVSNIKALYNAILPYMKEHPEKMFIIIANPSLMLTSTNNDEAARAREVTNWLTLSWLSENNWENKNVYVWNYFNVLTDIDNHHSVVDGQVVLHTEEDSGNTTINTYHGSDDHPSAIAAQKAASELVPCLNVWYNTWRAWRSSSHAVNSVSINAPTNAEGSYVYNLVSVKDATNDVVSVSGQSVTITVSSRELPTATISASTTSVCAGSEAPTITFMGSNGTAPYTFTYTLNGGNESVTTTSGNSVTVSQPTTTAGDFVYVLTGVTDSDNKTNTSSGTKTITVNSLPTAAVLGNTDIFVDEATTLTASGGTSYEWYYGTSANDSILSTTATYTTQQLSENTSYTVKVTNASGCSSSKTVNITVSPIPELPTATISASTTSVCAGSEAPTITFTGSNGAAPYTFRYTLNGEAKSAATTTGNSVTIRQPASVAGNYVYVLTEVTDADEKSNSLSETQTVTIKELPTATIAVDKSTSYYNGDNPVVTLTGNGGSAPYTFVYSINGGESQTISSIGTSNEVELIVPVDTEITLLYQLVGVQESEMGCHQSQSASVTTVITSTEDVVSDESVNLYPNPSSSYVNIDMDDKGSIFETVEIVDVTGKTVYVEILSEQPLLTINTSNLKAGLYMLRLKGHGTVVNKRLVID